VRFSSLIACALRTGDRRDRKLNSAEHDWQMGTKIGAGDFRGAGSSNV
jgi:hypothetical protein